MRAVIRQAEEIGDDLVQEPFLPDYGVPIVAERGNLRTSLGISCPYASTAPAAASRR